MEAVTSSISVLVDQFKMNTRLVKNVVAGISDEEAAKRPMPDSNPMVWIVGHIVHMRYSIAQQESPLGEVFSHGKELDTTPMPPLSEIMGHWDDISDKMCTALENMPEDALESKPPMELPIPNNHTTRSMMAFFCHHEALHLGQAGYL